MTTNQTIGGVPRVLLDTDREMRLYIAGPMTGIADYNFPAFNAMADKMRAAGWHVENPADHGLVPGADWADYLRYDIGCLASCEAIMLLPGWTASRGARLEVSIAKELGVVFMFADGAEREPAAQAQGEPVAYRYMDCNTGTCGPTKDGGTYYAEIPEYGRKWEVTTKAHGAVLIERKEHAIANGYVDSHPSLTVIIEPLYAEQPAAVAVITYQQVFKAYEYAESHPHKYLRGTTNWCAAVAHSLNIK